MPRFISTETAILVSLVCREMPELLKYITQHSAAVGKKDTPSPIPVLSTQQIQEACLHPSAIAQQTLRVVAIIQTTLNASLAKLVEIAKQRSNIESILARILGSKSEITAKENPEISVATVINELRQQLVALHQSEKEVESTMDSLRQEFGNTDKMLLQHAEEWLKHREEYFNELATQLEANGISLTDEEKVELRNGSTLSSSIQEKLETLTKLNIKLPSKASDFAIITNDAIVAALSRTMQNLDTARSIAKNLTAIGNESEASSKIRSAHAEGGERIIASATQLATAATEVTVLSPDRLLSFEQMAQRIELVPKTAETPGM